MQLGDGFVDRQVADRYVERVDVGEDAPANQVRRQEDNQRQRRDPGDDERRVPAVQPPQVEPAQRVLHQPADRRQVQPSALGDDALLARANVLALAHAVTPPRRAKFDIFRVVSVHRSALTTPLMSSIAETVPRVRPLAW